MPILTTRLTREVFFENMKRNADPWFSPFMEAYHFVRVGSYFYARYKPEYRWDRRMNERPQLWGRVTSSEGKTTVQYRFYLGLSPLDLLVAFLVATIAVPIYNLVQSQEHEVVVEQWLVYLIALVVVVVISIVTWIYTSVTESGKEGTELLERYLAAAAELEV